MKDTQQDAYTEPLAVETYDGEVIIIGPGRIGVSLTPEAAAQTAKRLAVAATAAESALSLAVGDPCHPSREASQDSSGVA